MKKQERTKIRAKAERLAKIKKDIRNGKITKEKAKKVLTNKK